MTIPRPRGIDPEQRDAPRPTGRSRPYASAHQVLLIGLLAAVYYGVGKVGLAAGDLPGNVTPVWPPTGLAVAALLIGGRQLWPGVFLGALLVNGLSSVPFPSAVGMAMGNTLEALLAALLFTEFAHGDRALRHVRDVAAFVGCAAVVATAVSATVGVVSLRLGDVIPTGAMWPTWRVWWAGDALGALVVAPLLLVWWFTTGGSRRRAPSRTGMVEGAAFAAGAAALTVVLSATLERPYAVFPALIWAALRWRQRGAVTVTAVIATATVVVTRAGDGAFYRGSAVDSLWRLATFLAVVALTGLVLAAVVTERDEQAERTQELTRALKRNVSDLERSNSELEAFAYSVSHDLRAPLRNIDGFSRNLQKRLGSDVDEESQRHLTRIRANAQAMGTLIDELLTFSRLQRQPLVPVEVDLGAAVETALGMLESARAGRAVELVVDPLPVVRGDRALLVQVYLNLIGNALKFTRDRALAHIHVGVDIREGTSVFYVADDGVGFDMEYAHKMFDVFQRLHHVDEFEGSGVGLALVSRVVTRHGGRVWAEGAVDQGATIFFTLDRCGS